MANCHEQFRPAGGIVFCWNLHSGVLRDFVAGGAGWWRVDRRRDGMDVAEAKGRRKTRRTQNGAAAGHFPPCVLSFDNALNRRARIHFRGGYARSERSPQSRAASFDYRSGTGGFRVDRAQYFLVLRIC